MRLALLSGANAQHSNPGPKVRLQAGRWRIVMDGWKDSTLAIYRDDKLFVFPVGSSEITFNEAGCIQVRFAERGTERCISVYAEKVA